MSYSGYVGSAVLMEHIIVSILIIRYYDTNILDILNIFNDREKTIFEVKSVEASYKDSIITTVAYALFCEEYEGAIWDKKQKTKYITIASLIYRDTIRSLINDNDLCKNFNGAFLRNRSYKLRNDVTLYLNDIKEKTNDCIIRDSFERIIYAVERNAY